MAVRPRRPGRGRSPRRPLVGCERPRVFTPPLRRLTRGTSLGFAVIDFAVGVLGISLHPWQRWLLIHGLELLPDGSFRFRTLVVLVARQNGKSTIGVVLSLFFLYVLGANLVIGTAQDLDQAEEVWQTAVDFVHGDDAIPELAALTERVVRVNGKKSLELVNGERYKVKAANRRAGRGLSGDLIELDELREHQSWDSWAAVSKTTMARANALVCAFSNAGDATSIVLRHLRKMGHAALGDPDGINAEDDPSSDPPDDVDEFALDDDDSLGIFEWSAAPGCAIGDRDGWAQANPSLGHPNGITERAINSAARTDPEWVFRCLDVATPILASGGWTSMGALAVGDRVKGVSGDWVNIVGVSPVRYNEPCYRVTLNDGRSVVCDEGHLWTVKDRRRCTWETLRTVDLIERGVTYHNPSMDFDVRNFTLPPVGSLEGPDVELPVHPYLLGLWLGDGSHRSAMVFVEDRDEAHVRAVMESCGAVITTRTEDSRHCYRLGFRTGRYGDFTGALHDLGIHGNKHIPDAYFTASREQRLWLLRGLMDSDGTVAKRSGRCTFTNTNEKLVVGVRTLVRSLGWKTADLAPGRYGKSHHLPRFDVSFTTRPDQPAPVTIPRKVANIRAARSYRDVRPATIALIEPVPSVPVRCIKVDAPDSLFLAGDLIPTHNTEVLCQWHDGFLEGPFPPGSWEATTDRESKVGDGQSIAVCVDVSWDRSMAHVGIAGLRDDGLPHVGVIASRAGTDWVVPWLTAPEAPPFKVCALQAAGAPVSSLLAEIYKAAEPAGGRVRFEVAEWSGSELARGTGVFYDQVRVVVGEGGGGKGLRHQVQPVLDVAAGAAAARPMGDGFVWDRKKSPVDVAPLIAVTGALWALTRPSGETPPPDIF
jgi:hypothetical protein